ncbi:MAG TPA: VOC family protein [Allosphingosinicella sp.]|nr:VOC family protein [Allosphingosinicella sp.]
MATSVEQEVAVGAISPFFIVRDVSDAIAHYRRLGFALRFAEPREAPFFAIVSRGGAQIFLKDLGTQELPVPNAGRHEFTAWDGFVYLDDPDALAAEFEAEGIAFRAPLRDRDDGLRGFEISDPDGYVLFFGRPLDRS